MTDRHRSPPTNMPLYRFRTERNKVLRQRRDLLHSAARQTHCDQRFSASPRCGAVCTAAKHAHLQRYKVLARSCNLRRRTVYCHALGDAETHSGPSIKLIACCRGADCNMFYVDSGVRGSKVLSVNLLSLTLLHVVIVIVSVVAE